MDRGHLIADAMASQDMTHIVRTLIELFDEMRDSRQKNLPRA
jgi:hypothetical protein